MCYRIEDSKNLVELRGVEPRSKRETHMPSTCLAYLWL